MECGPGGRWKVRRLAPAVARHGTGLSPQVPLPGAEVSPKETLLSKISNWSPRVKASTTVKSAPFGPAVKAQGGGPANWEFPPELGVHAVQAVANVPAAPNWNSCQRGSVTRK